MANEKRLIDANALKERAIRVSTVMEMGNKAHCYIKAVGTREIDKAPTVDAVEVVRCKDCRFSELDKAARYKPIDGEAEKPVYRCFYHWNGSETVSRNHFCSHGERRTNERTD